MATAIGRSPRKYNQMYVMVSTSAASFELFETMFGVFPDKIELFLKFGLEARSTVPGRSVCPNENSRSARLMARVCSPDLDLANPNWELAAVMPMTVFLTSDALVEDASTLIV